MRKVLKRLITKRKLPTTEYLAKSAHSSLTYTSPILILICLFQGATFFCHDWVVTTVRYGFILYLVWKKTWKHVVRHYHLESGVEEW